VVTVALKIKMLILDYDLSSVINDVDFYEAFCSALREVGRNCLNFDEFSVLLESDLLREYVSRYISEDAFWRRFRQLYVSRHSYPRRGLRELLIQVKRFGVKVAVLSGRETHPEYIWWDLRRHGLDELVDDVVTMHDLNTLFLREEFLFDKSPIIEYVKKKHGVIGDFVCIGDYVSDYYSCVKSGGLFIGIGSEVRIGVLKKAGTQLTATDFYEVLMRLQELGLLA
jgi:phosphoglycolate phosphatase-like HAD superfamily hydrolase